MATIYGQMGKNLNTFIFTLKTNMRSKRLCAHNICPYIYYTFDIETCTTLCITDKLLSTLHYNNRHNKCYPLHNLPAIRTAHTPRCSRGYHPPNNASHSTHPASINHTELSRSSLFKSVPCRQSHVQIAAVFANELRKRRRSCVFSSNTQPPTTKLKS